MGEYRLETLEGVWVRNDSSCTPAITSSVLPAVYFSVGRPLALTGEPWFKCSNESLKSLPIS